LIGVYPAEATSILGSISTAFFGAAIPEEIAKFFMLWLLLRKNQYFDEKMDGIVYAVCVSLGFAAVENIMYLFTNADSYLSVGIARAIFAVPGHFCFGVLMGYFYSLAKFEPQHRMRYSALALLAPIVAHGIYDSLLFIMQVYIPTWLESILLLGFLIFCFYLWKWAAKSIKRHLEK
jgi:RsiW-degrading membrane proteinase PrsW (M82 family)